MPCADVLVIGGGASGLAAAASAAEQGDHVLLLEAQSKPGKKILASGNGRCNLMNWNSPVYYGDDDFARAVFAECPREQIVGFFHRYGLILRSDQAGRVYPCTFQSSSVLETLLLALESNEASVITGQQVNRVERGANGFRVSTASGEMYEAGRVILATGGPAQPKLGSSSDGVQLISPFGHTAIPFKPALTPLITDSRSISGLSGIRVRCDVQIETDGKAVHSECGELLFTNDGISGICAMQCARFVSPGKSLCRLNLIYDLFSSISAAEQELLRRRAAFPDADPVTLIQGICVPKLAFAVCKQAGLPMRGEKNAELTVRQICSLAEALSCYTLRIMDIKGFDHAQVSSGGLACSLFSPHTMESLLQKGLFATGEVLNVDGDCGGFNLMFAWATGLLAGRNGRKAIC